jgi:hypothetical protein
VLLSTAGGTLLARSGRYALGVQSVPASVAVRQGSGSRKQRLSRSLAFWRGHQTLAAAVIFAVLSVVMVGQGLLPGRTLSSSDTLLSSVPWQSSKPGSVPGLGTNFELADSADVFQPFLQYTRSQLPSIPLWNPYVGAGRPFLADGQSAVFSPFSIPSYILPFWRSLAVVAILKLFLAGFGAYALGRVLGLRFGGALLSGVVFAFGTFFVVWLAWPLTSIYALIPWTLALIELLIRRPGRLTVAGLAVVLALQFLGGHPESSFHLVFVSIVFFVFRALLHWRRGDRSRAELLRPAIAFAVAGCAGAALAALALAPFLEFVLHSGDLSRRVSSAAGYWPRKYLGALFLHDYWGRPTQVDLESFMQVRGWYAGAATLMLAAAALILHRSAERIGVALFAVFCACMVVGIPPVFGIVSRLPGFSAAHNERLIIYVLMSLALLAGWGLDDLSDVRLPRRRLRQLVIGTATVIVCIPIVWLIAAGTLSLSRLGSGLRVAWGFEHPPVPAAGVNPGATVTATIVRDSALLIWLPLAAAAATLIVLRLRASGGRLAASWFAGLTVALLVLDLFRANMGFNPAIPIKTATPPVTGAIRYLQSRRPNRFVGVSTLQLSQPLPSDLAMRFGLYDARGYDFPVEKRFDALWRRYVAPGVGDFTQPEEFAGATPAALRALSLLSVSDLMVGPLQAIKLPLRGPGLSVAYRGADAVVYANANALPRVFIAPAQRTVSGENAALSAVTAPDFDGRRVAITEHPVPGVPQAGTGGAPPGSPGSATLKSYGSEHVVIDADASAPGLLVLTDTFYPGWTATVDGRSVPVERVDDVLRGVALSPGRHVVEFRYQPTSWTIGWIISLLAVIGVAVAVVTAVRGTRRGRR